MYQERNPTIESIVGSDSGITAQRKFFVSCERIYTMLNHEGALERPTFPINPLLLCVPEPCFAAILDCRTIHGTLWVLQRPRF